ncbi:hypothetical protein ACFXB3_40045 [Streptomyces sp. NPDC059447]|uniref:hypothetical protein n=1 Tax=Streptomyces sp. NPDC059447 TaxID=3346834 RepID=UPI003689A834
MTLAGLAWLLLLQKRHPHQTARQPAEPVGGGCIVTALSLFQFSPRSVVTGPSPQARGRPPRDTEDGRLGRKSIALTNSGQTLIWLLIFSEEAGSHPTSVKALSWLWSSCCAV